MLLRGTVPFEGTNAKTLVLNIHFGATHLLGDKFVPFGLPAKPVSECVHVETRPALCHETTIPKRPHPLPVEYLSRRGN